VVGISEVRGSLILLNFCLSEQDFVGQTAVNWSFSEELTQHLIYTYSFYLNFLDKWKDSSIYYPEWESIHYADLEPIPKHSI
jgi:hypothetical protein